MPRLRTACAVAVLTAALLLLGALQPPSAPAGDFQIAPMGLQLRKGQMSGTITVTNEAKEKLNLQLSALVWEQAEDGQDRYAETQEVIFYPRIMTVGPGEQRVIRLGLKGAAGARERAYRLLLEELPVQGEKAPRKQGGVAIVMRVSLPVFLAPVRADERGSVELLSMERGSLAAAVRNGGNVHFQLRTVTARGRAADGKVLFEQEQPGWYVLPGAARPYRFDVPAEVCRRLAAIEVHAVGETLSVRGTLDVGKEMCTP